jgi:hypothetical protein
LRDELQSKQCISAQWFCSVAMALKSTGSGSAAAVTVLDGSVRGVGETENSQWLFSDRADTTSALEFRDEGQMALLSSRNGGRNTRQSGNDHFEICPQLKSATFTKMAKMPDCCMCSQ